MELTHEFRVGVPVERAWATLLDVERIAPCLPGAQLEEIEGEEFRGIVKVKVGPISAQYKGKATFLERDEAAGKAVLRAEGRDTRGQGNANATITVTLVPDGGGTSVSIVTDLMITGRVAQLGRGVLADVSAKLLNEFVACLEKEVLAQLDDSTASPPVADEGSGPAPGSRRIEGPAAKPIDLLETAGAPVLKRLAPVLVAVLLYLLVRRLTRGS